MGLNIRSRSDVGRIKRIIGVLPQEFSAVDNLTVYENVLLAAAAKGVGKSFRDLLEGLGLWEVRGRLFSKLSGGMKRKVGLAMALVGDPEVRVAGRDTKWPSSSPKRVPPASPFGKGGPRYAFEV